jgi:hypothetical protein
MKSFFRLVLSAVLLIVPESAIASNKDIQKTTSDWLEAERTNILLTDDSSLFQMAQKYYDAWPSKWYQPDLNGDGNPDFVMFGIRKPSNAAIEWVDDFDMCGADECKDWAVAPFIMLSEKVDNESTHFRKPRDKEISTKKLIARTSGGKTIFADFNGDGLDDLYVPTWGMGANKGAIDSLIMSSKNGNYQDVAPNIKRMNIRSLRHWASAGDIDNDGDIDIIAGDLGPHNGQAGAKIDCFFNDGKGNFSHSNCLKINTFSKDKFRSWGGTLFDLDADGDLDLWVSFQGKKPTIFLGDGSGKYSSNSKIEIDFPKSWPTKMRQIGYVMASDIEDDGFVDIFFSVQGKSNCGKTYCGSYVGYFKNDKGKLTFNNFIEKVEENELLIWGRTSMIVVKDLNADGLKDVYLKRNFKSPIYFQDVNGRFNPSNTFLNSSLKAPVLFEEISPKTSITSKNTTLNNSDNPPLSDTPDENLCQLALNETGSDWNTNKQIWVKEAKKRGFNVKICKLYSNRLKPETPDGTHSAVQVCKQALDGDKWNLNNSDWVREAKGRGYDITICKSFLN